MEHSLQFPVLSITTNSWIFQISDHTPLSHICVHSVCWDLIDDGPALRMRSPGTPSIPAAFPNFICFTASSTSLSSDAGSVFWSMERSLDYRAFIIRFREKVMSILFPSPHNVFWLCECFPFLSFITLCRALKVVIFN